MRYQSEAALFTTPDLPSTKIISNMAILYNLAAATFPAEQTALLTGTSTGSPCIIDIKG